MHISLETRALYSTIDQNYLVSFTDTLLAFEISIKVSHEKKPAVKAIN